MSAKATATSFVLVCGIAIALLTALDLDGTADAQPATDQGVHPAAAAIVQTSSCESINGPFAAVPEAPTQLTATESRPAETVRVGTAGHGAAPYANGHDQALPPHCFVRGVIAPQIQFELRLPDRASWNGDYFQVFCTGACGTKLTEACFPALERGFAVATNDGGHSGQGLGFHIWGWNNRPDEVDFGHRANHVQAQVSKAIIEAYYGRASAKSYGAGCSKGGQAAVMESARYPDDFDGLIANAPVNHYSGRAGAFAWIAQANHGINGMPILSDADMETLHQAVLRDCDALDGLADGVINDPSTCKFKPQSLRCRPGSPTPCFSPQKVTAVEKIYSPPTNSAGRRVFASGQAYGSEREAKFIVSGIPGFTRPGGEEIANGFLGYLAFPDDPGPNFTWKDFDFDRDPKRMQKLAPLWDVQDEVLTRYRKSGGKLLIYHGTADAGIPVLATVDWYKRLVREMGGLHATQDFARLFVVPGAAHCNGGDGTDRLDPITALRDWVERDTPPEKIVAWREVGGRVDLRIPTYPYPLVPRYKGSGDLTDPDSFEPVRSPSW